jgi:hypothetical protein
MYVSSRIATVVLCKMVVVGALAALGCQPSSRANGRQAAKPAGSPVEQAHAYERGAGLARDYRAAAELFRAACDAGRGDVLACGEWIRAGLRSRGTKLDRPAIQALATKICVDRRDAFGCVVTDLLSAKEAEIPKPVMDVIKDVLAHLQPCDAAHPSECQAAMLGSALDFSGGSTAQARRLDLEERLCSAGIVAGCVELRHAAGASTEAVADAGRRLQAACDAGDADACAAAPDRAEFPLKQLCAASDYEACGALGCRGDAEAAALASRQGVLASECGRLGRPTRAESAGRARTTLAKLTEFKNQMCACRDRACIDRVQTEIQRWSAAELETSDESAEPPEELRREIERTSDELGACARN